MQGIQKITQEVNKKSKIGSEETTKKVIVAFLEVFKQRFTFSDAPSFNIRASQLGDGLSLPDKLTQELLRWILKNSLPGTHPKARRSAAITRAGYWNHSFARRIGALSTQRRSTGW